MYYSNDRSQTPSALPAIGESREQQRVGAALDECRNSPNCESVYYNECDGSPHPLYLCSRALGFEMRGPPHNETHCAFHRLGYYHRAYGMHCNGAHYGAYPSVEAAVQACSVDPGCGAVYDHQCDSSTGDVYLCPKETMYAYEHETSLTYAPPHQDRSMRGSCLYLRPPWRSMLTCTTPAVETNSTGAVSVRVSLNAQQFVGNASVDFVFHEQPSVASISPSSGASVGGTLVNVSGSGFADGSQYTCAFGSSVVGATFVPSLGVISCSAPAGLYGSAVALKVSLNAQQYSSEVHTFGYHGVTTVGTYSPSSGPSAGGTRVVVRGAELYGGSDYRCRFGACGECETAWSCGACVVNATYVAESVLGLGDDAIECVSPSGSAAGVALEVSLNSQQYTRTNLSTLLFTYYEVAVVSSVSPSLGPRDGATLVTILGSGLNGVATNLKCRFAVTAGTTSFSSTADATYVSSTNGILCRATSSATIGSAGLQISLNGQQFGPSALSYRYYARPRVSSLMPGAGPIGGNTTVQVRGFGLAGGDGAGPHYVCRFGLLSVSATMTLSTPGEGKLTCLSPANTASSRALEVSINGQDFTADGVLFRWVPPITLDGGSSSGTSSSATSSGGTSSGGSSGGPSPGSGSAGGAVGSNGTGVPVPPGYIAPPSPPSIDEATLREAASIRSFGLCPLSGPDLGGTLVRIFAPSFQGGTDYRCRFGEGPTALVEASYFAPTEILRCMTSPLTADGAKIVAISLNAQDFATYPVAFAHVGPTCWEHERARQRL